MKKILAMLLAAMLVLSFAGCSGEKATEEKSPVALKIGNTEFTVEDVNYMYVSSFTDIYNYYASYYGDYLSNILDINVPLEEQMADETTTWHDYILNYSLGTLTTYTGIYEEAKENGFVLPEDYQTDVDTLEEQLSEIAASNGMTDEEYLHYMYGGSVSIDCLKKMTEFNYTVAAYAEAYGEEVEITEEDILAYYEANKKDIDTVSMHYFFVSPYSDEEGSEYTSEMAKADAEALTATTTAEEFEALAYELADETRKAAYDNGESTFITGMAYSSVGIEEVAEWLFDEARVAGETYCYHDETNKNYLVVRFEERNDPDYDYVDVRHILIAPEKGEDGKMSDEAWAAAEAKATEVYNGYLAGEMTEEAFGELAKEHSADGSAAQGGLYKNVRKGQMVQNFNDWCYDEARVSGDTGIVKTPYGFHIMYFVGIGDNNLVATIEPTLKNERLDLWVMECAEGLTEERTESFSEVGGMIDDIVSAANEYAGTETSEETEKETKSYTGIIIGVLVAVIVVCVIVIIKNAGKKKTEPEAEAEELSETEEPVLEATDEDLTEEELLAEEAFEENPSEEAEEVTEEETSEE